MIRFFVLIFSLLYANLPLYGYSLLSFQYIALTGNAGGQNAYSLSLAQENKREYNLFMNQNLSTGNYPLCGATYNLRRNLLPVEAVLTAFIQVGVGLATAGPILALTWNLTALQIVRIDVTTHLYFSQLRPIVWNYPLWLGLTLPV